MKFSTHGLSVLLTVLLSSALFSNAVLGAVAERVKVVTTFSILEDWVKVVGGEHVEVHSLVGPDEDVHVYQASPSDVQHIAHADLLVMNGLGLEGWLNRVVSSSGFAGVSLIASKGLRAIGTGGHEHGHEKDEHGQGDHGKSGDQHEGAVAHGSSDPHAWLSLTAAKTYVHNIERALITTSPAYADYFHQRTVAYIESIDALASEMKKQFSMVPVVQRRLVVPHNAFAYLARDYDIEIYSLQGLSTESETSAAHIARLVRAIIASDIRAIFAENVMNSRLIEQVVHETGATLGGRLISGALSKKLAPNYLAMMRYNTEQIVRTLKSSMLK